MKNCITLTVSDEGVSTTFQSPANLEESMQILGTAILGVMNDVMTQVPDANKKVVKETIYDDTNAFFSQILHQFAPEIEARPDLTAEAILKAENDILKATPTSKAAKRAVRELRRK